MSYPIRRLNAGDASAYREIRLEGLRDSPKSFGDTYDEARARPESYWTGLFSGKRAFFGAFSGDRIVGTANFLPGLGRASAHRGLLLGMYVSPTARGTGCAALLVQAALDHAAAEGFAQVHLGVGAHNKAAERLYEKAGFVRYGTEPRGLRIDGEYLDEHLMVKFLDGHDWRP